MKNTYLIFTLFLVLASCSEWKYSKGLKAKQPERYTLGKGAEQQPAENLATTTARRAEPAGETETPVTDNVVLSETATPARSAEAETAAPALPVDLDEVTVLRHEGDTLESVDEEALDIAFAAEKHGRTSRTLGIIGLILTLTYLFALVGLVLSIIALIKGVKSLKARYNTPDGVRMARAGVITSSIVIGLYVLFILFLIAIIVIFLL